MDRTTLLCAQQHEDAEHQGPARWLTLCRTVRVAAGYCLQNIHHLSMHPFTDHVLCPSHSPILADKGLLARHVTSHKIFDLAKPSVFRT